MSEFQFDDAASPDRSIKQRYTSIDISSVNVYQFMNEAFFGTGGFRTGEYLIPFSRESDYLSRRKLAHYKNYTKPILLAMVDPVFAQVAPRAITSESGSTVESLFETFIKNCDVAGTHLQEYTHNACNICRRHGIVFTVMDNFGSEQQPATLADAERLRVMPYIYTKQASEVDSYECDRFGNLEWIIFTDIPVTVNGKKELRWRKWTINESIILKKDKKGDWEVLSSYTHGLGRVPVIASFSEICDKTNYLPEPPAYDIARVNFVIYNQSTEIRDQERAQAFSIFFGQGLPDGDHVFGLNNFINLAMEVTIPPGYASPPFEIIRGLVENQEQMRKDLFILAKQMGVVGVEYATSGIEKAFDFQGEEGTLKRTSVIATTLEQKIAELFMSYTKESFVYTVSYPVDFAPTGQDREVDRIEKIFKMPISEKFSLRLQQKLAKVVFADDESEVLQEIIEDIDEQIEAADAEPVEEEPVVEPVAEEGSTEEAETMDEETPEV